MSKPMRSAASRHSRPLAAASPSSGADQAAGRPTLHRAEWLVPVASPPLQNGAVLVQGGRILAVGPYREVKAASPGEAKEIDHGPSALLPSLVNAHTHLELSGLVGRIELPTNDFAHWLTALLALRPLMTQEFLEEGLALGQQGLLAGGCCLCGDITNGACFQPSCPSRQGKLPTGTHKELREGSSSAPATLNTRHSAPGTRHSPFTRQIFLEILGFDRQGLAEALDEESAALLGMPSPWRVPPNLAAHACYSTAGAVIREAKEWCRARGRWFSIHVAEHPEELEFLAHGTGFCRELLDALGRWNPRWVPPGTSPVRYLEGLQVLDSKTLLVHAVHLTEDDWKAVVKNHCAVCFCPRSNHNLRVGQPDIGKAWRYGLPVALGTDSLASNTDLNLFAEAAYVLDHYPDVPPEAVIPMITLGGARALGQERHWGSIEPGKQAALLAVSVPASVLPHQLSETIIQQGNKGAWQWLHHSANRCD